MQELIAEIIAKNDYKKFTKLISLGFEFNVSELNEDSLAKFGSADNLIFEGIVDNDLNKIQKINKLKINQVNNANSIPLHWAIILGRNSIVKYLLDNDADINAENRDGENSYFLAARFNNIQAMQQLLEKTKDKNLIFKGNKRGFTALHLAFTHHNYQLAELMLKLTEDQHMLMKDIHNDSCLHWITWGAFQNDHTKQKLLNIFLKHLESTKNRQKIVQSLMNIENAIGMKPIDWLERYNQQESLKTLGKLK